MPIGIPQMGIDRKTFKRYIIFHISFRSPRSDGAAVADDDAAACPLGLLPLYGWTAAAAGLLPKTAAAGVRIRHTGTAAADKHTRNRTGN